MSKRKSIKRKLSRCISRIKYVIPLICPGICADINEKIHTCSSVLDISVHPKGIGIGNIDLDGVMQLKVYDMPALFTCFETSVFTHSARCFILDFLTPEIADCYFRTYEKEYGILSQSDESDSE